MSNNKTSFWIEETIGTVALLGFAAIAPLYTFSLEPPPMKAPVAPAASHAPHLLLPLQCDAWIVQSGDGISEPRARCYLTPGKKGK